MKKVTAILVLGLLFALTNVGNASDFKQEVARLGGIFNEPDGYISVPPKKNLDMNYNYALKHPKVKYEVRYALRPIPKEIPKEKANKLLDVSVFSITRNIAQSGSIKNSQSLDPKYKRTFGADDGISAVVENMTSDFANGYKNCMLIGIHKDNIGEFYIFHLFDNNDDVKQYIGEIFFSLKFKDAGFSDRSRTGQSGEPTEPQIRPVRIRPAH